MGPAPTYSQSMTGVILRVMYKYVINIIIQLLLSGGSIQRKKQTQMDQGPIILTCGKILLVI